MIKVLFVCMGNICRSPTAQGVFEARLRKAGLDREITADSAGTTGYHVGDSPDTRASKAAKSRGIDIGHYRARKVEPEDFLDYDIVLAMDQANYKALAHMAGSRAREKLRMFLEFAPDHGENVPDPYYGGADGFENVLDMCEAAADGLIRYLAHKHGLKLKYAKDA